LPLKAVAFNTAILKAILEQNDSPMGALRRRSVSSRFPLGNRIFTAAVGPALYSFMTEINEESRYDESR
jgi:hypothetical protein